MTAPIYTEFQDINTVLQCLYGNTDTCYYLQNFVTERKIDEELAKTTRFVGEKDEILSMINNFGRGKSSVKFINLTVLTNTFIH